MRKGAKRNKKRLQCSLKNEVAKYPNTTVCSFIKTGMAFDDSELFEPRDRDGIVRHTVAAGGVVSSKK